MPTTVLVHLAISWGPVAPVSPAHQVVQAGWGRTGAKDWPVCVPSGGQIGAGDGGPGRLRRAPTW